MRLPKPHAGDVSEWHKFKKKRRDVLNAKAKPKTPAIVDIEEPVHEKKPAPELIVMKQDRKGFRYIEAAKRSKKERIGWVYVRDYNPETDGPPVNDFIKENIEGSRPQVRPGLEQLRPSIRGGR